MWHLATAVSEGGNRVTWHAFTCPCSRVKPGSLCHNKHNNSHTTQETVFTFGYDRLTMMLLFWCGFILTTVLVNVCYNNYTLCVHVLVFREIGLSLSGCISSIKKEMYPNTLFTLVYSICSTGICSICSLCSMQYTICSLCSTVYSM